jgi:tetratricopeptide (TPR) repeat protein
MYLEPRRRRRTNPWRALFLLTLVAGAAYVLTLVDRQEIESPFVPTPTPTRSAYYYVVEAEEFYRQGNLGAAIEAFERAHELDPDDVTIHVPLVKLLTLQGHTREAVELGEDGVALAEEYAPIWAVLCMAYDWDGEVPAAIDSCRRSLDIDPTYAEGYAYLAEAYADAGRWDDAVEEIQIALELNPNSVDAHRNHGYVLEMMGNWSGAVQAYQRALEIHPNLAYIYVALGWNYQALADTASAIESFRRASELAPDWAEPLDRLGWAYRAIEDYEQAQFYLEQAIEVDPEYASAYGHLAYTFWSRRNYEDAIPNYQRAIELAYRSSRRDARGFYVSIEPLDDEDPYPSTDVMLRGDLIWTDGAKTRGSADLVTDGFDAEWSAAEGTLEFNSVTGEYNLTLTGVPAVSAEQVYVGWFEGLYALDGLPLSTGPLPIEVDGSLDLELVAEPVDGPRIEHLYTLGLCYFYRAECERAYPLFEAALQIDNEEINALEGIQLCLEAEGTPVPTTSP